jgi:hypothetical protein
MDRLKISPFCHASLEISALRIAFGLALRSLLDRFNLSV